VLSGVRRTYRDLMLKSAESPGATLGQRLYAARHHSELTVEEAANAAGVSPADIAAVEAGESGSQATISAVEGLLLRLGGR
jgi:transcriptional regulator with XRE-family HTH domain